MSHKINISSRDVLWCYLGYFLNFGVNLIVLPAVLKFLTVKELGLWYIFISISTIVQMLDFGFSPVMQRNITYVWNGAQQICREGFADKTCDHHHYNKVLMSQILQVSNRIYLLIGVIILGLMTTAGSCFLVAIAGDMPWQSYFYAWMVYSFGTFGATYWGRWITYLSAIGKVAQAQKAQIITKLLYIIFTFLGLWWGGGLLAIAVALVLSSLIPRLFVQHFFQKIVFDAEDVFAAITGAEFRHYWGIIWYNAKKYGIASLSGILASQSLTLICSYYYGLDVCSEFGLSTQILNVAATVGAIMFHAYFPAISAARASNQMEELQHKFAMTITMAWIVMLSGSLVIILGGNWIFALAGINKKLLPTLPLLLLAVNLMLDRNTQLCCGMITTGNRVPFVTASLVSAVAGIVLCIAAAATQIGGVSGILVATLLVQGSYNYWRWPLDVFRELRMKPQAILRRGLQIHMEHARGLVNRWL